MTKRKQENPMFTEPVGERAPGLQKAMEALFPMHMERLNAGECPICGDPVNPENFRDEASRREFKITGMCQDCQDEFFEEGEDG